MKPVWFLFSFFVFIVIHFFHIFPFFSYGAHRYFLLMGVRDEKYRTEKKKKDRLKLLLAHMRSSPIVRGIIISTDMRCREDNEKNKKMHVYASSLIIIIIIYTSYLRKIIVFVRTSRYDDSVFEYYYRDSHCSPDVVLEIISINDNT